MQLHERIRKLRGELIERDGVAVPASLQGVTKRRINDVLEQLDRSTPDRIDVVFAMLDDRLPSWFSSVASTLKFSDGASIAHLGCHVGILQRNSDKLDREGRDYWIKPLRDIGAIDTVYLDGTSRKFLPGHPRAKSPNSAYRLAAEFKDILQADETAWKEQIAAWIHADRLRTRLEFQAQQSAVTSGVIASAHVDLIRACVEFYAPRFLSGFEVVFVDDADGRRVTDDDREQLEAHGLSFELGDSMPDVLLVNDETNELWVIEAVTSDGEVDNHKVARLLDYTRRCGKDGVGFTTAYPSWKLASQRQSAHKNIPPHTYVWIRDDGAKHYRAEDFGGGNSPSTISSTLS